MSNRNNIYLLNKPTKLLDFKSSYYPSIGPPGLQGIKGEKGDKSNSIHVFIEKYTPDSYIGENNDLFINTNYGYIYRKINDNWILEFCINEFIDVNYIGPKGDKGDLGEKGNNGSQIYTEPRIPNKLLGNNGDIYINTNNGNMYQKINGS
ncbi:collagen-like protein [Megavirus lba]|uniref:Collagen-like protein n=1 Tax=Megavirus lba TaxID=1235314 RepID=L7XZH1_9VIRU|nr:collagen-like protein [Megavirus lba]